MKKILIAYAVPFLFTHLTSSAQILDISRYLDEEGYYDFENSEIRMSPLIFFSTYKSQLGLGISDSIGHDSIFVEESYDERLTKSDYVQYYKGIKVEGTQFFAIQDREGNITNAYSNLVPELNISTEPNISESLALDLALSFINADEYSWENADLEMAKIMKTGNESATWYPHGTLVIRKVWNPHIESTEYALQWKFNITWLNTSETINPVIQFSDVYVNASGDFSDVSGPSCIHSSLGIGPQIDFSKYTLQPQASDEFDATPLNLTKWKVDIYESAHACDPINPHDLSLSSPSNVLFRAVPDYSGFTTNVVTLLTKKENTLLTYNCPSWLGSMTNTYNYSSATLDSKDRYLYGYFEARVKFPNSNTPRDISQDFWTWGCDGPSNDYSEIDVLEHFSYDAHDDSSNSRYPSNTHKTIGTCDNRCPGEPSYKPVMCENLSAEFHTYGFDWTPSKLSFYFDESPLYEVLRPYSDDFTNFHNLLIACHNPAAPISSLETMRVVLSQGVRGGSSLPPAQNENHYFDIDYFRYYKKNPEIIGPNFSNSGCIGNTYTFQAKMYSSASTTDIYTWSVSSGATIIGSNTGSTCQIRMDAGSFVTITVTAREAGTSNYTYNTGARTSSSSIYFILSTPGAPQMVITPFNNSSCLQRVLAYNVPGAENFYFSHNNGNTWLPGQLITTTVFGVTDEYWTDGTHFSLSSLPRTFLCKTENCNGQSTITRRTFTHGNGIGCAPRIGRKIVNNENNTLNIEPNPSTNIVKFKYSIGFDQAVSLIITDLNGKLIDMPINNELNEGGEHFFSYSLDNISCGIYMCKLITGNSTLTNKLVIMK